MSPRTCSAPRRVGPLRGVRVTLGSGGLSRAIPVRYYSVLSETGWQLFRGPVRSRRPSKLVIVAQILLALSDLLGF